MEPAAFTFTRHAPPFKWPSRTREFTLEETHAFFYCRLNWLQPIRPSYQSPYDHLPFPSLLVILLCNRQTLSVLADGRGGWSQLQQIVYKRFSVLLLYS
jgi:hypothetical protein